MDGVWHKRSWGGSVENVSVLVAIGVDDTGHREVIGVAEGMKEDKASWEQFIRSMIERGLKGVRLVVGDRCAGLVATVGEMLPQADTSGAWSTSCATCSPRCRPPTANGRPPRSCSSAPGSATSPSTIGRAAATWTCPGSTASCNQPTEVIPPTTDQATFAQTSAQPLRRLRGLSMPLTGAYYPRAACCNTDLALLLCHRQQSEQQASSGRRNQSVR